MSMLSHILYDVALILVSYAALYLAIVLGCACCVHATTMPGGQRVRAAFNSWMPRFLNHDGFTLFGVNWFEGPDAPADLVAHEYDHAEQERRLLYVFYPPVYLFFLWRDGYRLNQMEIHARAYSRARRSQFVALPIVAKPTGLPGAGSAAASPEPGRTI